MHRLLFVLFLMLSTVTNARSIEEQLADSFNKLVNKAQASMVYDTKKLCEEKLVEHQIHIFDDYYQDYVTIELFLPEDFQDKESVCGKFGSKGKYASEIEKSAANELKVNARGHGCFTPPDYKLKFHSNDSGLVLRGYGNEKFSISGSFTINPK